jgi:hypothetical protein
MDIDRRQVLIGAAGAAIAGVFGPVRAGLGPLQPGVRSSDEWHPLARSLLERARRIGGVCGASDRAVIERTIRRFADASGYAEQPVIKWMDTATDAFDHLSRFGLDALLAMGTAGFWRSCRPLASTDARVFDRAFEIRMTANELIGVDEHDRFLMAPPERTSWSMNALLGCSARTLKD